MAGSTACPARWPFLKSGFALMAIYRPIATGDGFDLTISIDPQAGSSSTAVEKARRRQRNAKPG
jgi:hypothetical protein